MIELLSQYSGIQLLIASLALLTSLIISLSMHEFAHAFAAYKFGDDTAKLKGRLTLNPLAHVDFVGFLCCALFGFGWAKPVPINPLKFKKYRTGLIWVSIAGILVNFILAFIFGGLFVLILKYANSGGNFILFLYLFFNFMFMINACLCVFNLLPIYPLDGFNLVSALTKYDNKFVAFMYKYGFIVLLVLLFLFRDFIGLLINALITPIYLFWILIL